VLKEVQAVIQLLFLQPLHLLHHTVAAAILQEKKRKFN
jgi:hypothetical protein